MNNMNLISVFLLSTILGISYGTFLFGRSAEPVYSSVPRGIGGLAAEQIQALSGNPLFRHMATPMEAASAQLGSPIIRKSNFPPAMGHPLGIEMQTESTIHSPSGSVEPYINLFIPTGKCANGFYCRAVLSAYYNKQSKTMNVLAGYTIFSTTTASGTIPSIFLGRVSTTSPAEIAHYSMTLSTEMKRELSDLCNYSVEEGQTAFQAATDAMSTCSTFSGYGCSRYSWITSCSI